MPWARFDDQAADHPKFALLGDYAPLCGWLWFAAILYCNRHLTNGVISRVSLSQCWPYRHIGISHAAVMSEPDGKGFPLAEFGNDPDVDDLISKLISVQLLDEIEPGMYRVHDFLKYNPSRRAVLHLRKLKQQAGKRGGEASGQARAKARASRSGSALPNTPTRPTTKSFTPKDSDVLSSEEEAEHERRKAEARELLRSVTNSLPSPPKA